MQLCILLRSLWKGMTPTFILSLVSRGGVQIIVETLTKPWEWYTGALKSFVSEWMSDWEPIDEYNAAAVKMSMWCFWVRQVGV